MGRRRSRNKYTFDGFVGEDIIKRGGGFHIRELPFYQPGLPFRRDADVFQRYAEVVEHGINIGERMLAHANEGI